MSTVEQVVSSLTKSKCIQNWMRKLLTSWDNLQIVVSIAIVILVGLSPLVVKSPYYLNIIIMTALFAFVGLAWNIVGGFAGQLFIGIASFVGIGAYTTTILLVQFSVSPWIGLFASAIAAMILGAFISFLTLRYGLKGDYLALFTLAIMTMLSIVFKRFQIAGGAVGLLISFQEDSLRNMTFISKVPYLYIVTSLLLIGVVIHYLVYRSKIGKCLIAIREDEDAAAALGVNTTYYKTIAVLITSAMAGVGGGFFAVYTTFIDPNLVFGLGFNVEFLIAPIIGGRGTIIGPILGSILNKPIAEIVRGSFSGERGGTTLIIYGIFMMFFILFLPEGIAGLIRRPYEKMRRHLMKKGQ